MLYKIVTYNQISAQFNEKEILDAQVKEIVVLLLLGWFETMTEKSFEGRGNIFVNIFFFPDILLVIASGYEP